MTTMPYIYEVADDVGTILWSGLTCKPSPRFRRVLRAAKERPTNQGIGSVVAMSKPCGTSFLLI